MNMGPFICITFDNDDFLKRFPPLKGVYTEEILSLVSSKRCYNNDYHKRFSISSNTAGQLLRNVFSLSFVHLHCILMLEL